MTKQPSLSLETFLPYRLSIASNRVSDLVAEAYDRLFGLNIAEWRVIAVLGEASPLTQLGIVRQTVMDKMTVSRAVRPLIERGLIDRSPHSGDKRSSLLSLSVVGRALYESVGPAALDMEKALLAEFSPEEIRSLDSALRKIEAAAVRLSRKPA